MSTTTEKRHELPDEYEMSTSVDGSMAIIREINKIVSWEKMRKLMPAIAKVLTDAGVDFSNARIPSDDELETAIQEAMQEGYLGELYTLLPR